MVPATGEPGTESFPPPFFPPDSLVLILKTAGFKNE